MDNHIDHDRKNGPIATAAYALFDVGNSAVGAMHATFIFAVYFTTTIAVSYTHLTLPTKRIV